MTWSATLEVVRGSFRVAATLDGTAPLLGLIGPNGAGKSTLLRALLGVDSAAVGRVVIKTRVCQDSEQGLWVPVEARRMAYVPQGLGLFPHLRVEDNLAFGLPRDAISRERLRDALERFELGALRRRFPHQLSGGEQQRVALARALMREPDLLLLDEPMSQLDAPTRRSVRAWLAEQLSARDLATVMVSHDRRDFEPFDPPLVVLEGGRITQRGRLQELEQDPVSDFVREFVGS